MELKKITKRIQMRRLKRLYLTAFPKWERKPFRLMVRKQKEGFMDLLSIEENGEFIGLAFLAKNGDLVLLDYFAIDDSKRAGGYGTRALKAILEHYAGLRMVLEIESTEIAAENHGDRVRRKNFYLRNGLTALPFQVSLFGGEMEMLSNGTSVTFPEYQSIYTSCFSPRSKRFVKLLKTLS